MTARISLFQNQYKNNQNHPDLRGEIHIPISLVQELAYYVNNNQRISPGYGQNAEPGVTVRVSVWAQQPNPQKPNGPVLTGSLESPAETDSRAQQKAAAQPAAAPQQWGAPAQPAQAHAPAPAYRQAPPPPYGQQPAPAPQPQYAPPAQPPAPPAPAYGQPAAPAYGQAAAYGQPGQAPLI